MPDARLSIGTVSRATGVPVGTLRTWESRYGFPVPLRRPSGHRVYPASAVARLRRVVDALARGHRPCDAVPADDAGLDALLAATPASRATPPADTSPDPTLAPLMAAVAAFDAEALRQHLLAAWARLGPATFLDHTLGPLVRAVGEGWSAGVLDIRHEHFVSQRIGDLLRVLRVPFDDRADGPPVVFATLPGEQHELGLLMAALVVAATGNRVLYLGIETPVDEIAAVARDVNAGAIAISISRASGGSPVRRAVARLRRRVPAHVRVLVGGEGAPAPPDRVDSLSSFDQLSTWSQHLRNA